VVLTKEYIMKHRTQAGSWTKAQIQALGLDYPPRHGWIAQLIGKELSESQAQLFEEAKHLRAGKAKQLTNIEKAITLIVQLVGTLSDKDIGRIYKAVYVERARRMIDGMS